MLAVAVGLAEGFSEKELDLAVEAAQVVAGPLLHGFVQVGREAEEKGLTLGHGGKGGGMGGDGRAEMGLDEKGRVYW